MGSLQRPAADVDARVREEAQKEFEAAVNAGILHLKQYVASLCSQQANPIIRVFTCSIKGAVSHWRILDEQPSVALHTG